MSVADHFSGSKPKNLKTNNRRLILNALRQTEEATVADLAQQLNLSRTIVMRALKLYVENNWVLACGKGASTEEGGKKPLLFRFNEKKGFILLIQWMPSQTITVLSDLRGNPLDSEVIFHTKGDEVHHILPNIVMALSNLLSRGNWRKDQILRLGIATHGVTDFWRGEVIRSPHFPTWSPRTPLAKLILSSLELDVPWDMDNYIRFQALAEIQTPRFSEVQSLVAIDGSHGLGAGFMSSRQRLLGPHFLAGEIGHMVVDPSDQQICHCGNRGCLENKVSVSRFMHHAHQYFDSDDHPILKCSSAEEQLKTLFDLSQNGDVVSLKIRDHLSYWWSLGICNIAVSFDPEVIVLQGCYVSGGESFLAEIRQKVRERLMHLGDAPCIELSELGDDRCLKGAAAGAIENLFADIQFYED